MCDIGTGHGFSAKPASTGWDPLRIARAWIELMKRLGYTDSPIGLAAWMLDHDPKSYQLIARAFDGNPGGLSRDDVLDKVTLYWLTNTGISSAQLYRENKFGFFNVQGVKIPVGVSVFPDELYEAPRHTIGR